MKSIRDLRVQAEEPRDMSAILTASIVNALRSNPNATHHTVSFYEYNKLFEAITCLNDAGYQFMVEFNMDTPKSHLMNVTIRIR